MAEQASLINELDIKLTKTLADERGLTVSANWITNGIWAMKQVRIANRSVLSCTECLKRFAGVDRFSKMDDENFDALWNDDQVFEKWARTNIHHSTGYGDFTLWKCENGQEGYLSRSAGEELGLEEMYGDGTGPVWDARYRDEASICCMMASEPTATLLPLKPTITASGPMGDVSFEGLSVDSELEPELIPLPKLPAEAFDITAAEPPKISSLVTVGKLKYLCTAIHRPAEGDQLTEDWTPVSCTLRRAYDPDQFTKGEFTPEHLTDGIFEFDYRNTHFAVLLAEPPKVGHISVTKEAIAEDQEATKDPLLEEAARFCHEHGHASTSMLQRKFSIGFQRASRMLDQMEKLAIVGPRNGPNPREVIISFKDMEQLFKTSS